MFILRLYGKHVSFEPKRKYTKYHIVELIVYITIANNHVAHLNIEMCIKNTNNPSI